MKEVYQPKPTLTYKLGQYIYELAGSHFISEAVPVFSKTVARFFEKKRSIAYGAAVEMLDEIGSGTEGEFRSTPNGCYFTFDKNLPTLPETLNHEGPSAAELVKRNYDINLIYFDIQEVCNN